MTFRPLMSTIPRLLLPCPHQTFLLKPKLLSESVEALSFSTGEQVLGETNNELS